MGSVADDLGPEATPEPEAWPPAPRAGETQAQAPVRAPAREPSTPAPTDDEVDAAAGNGAAAATATSVGYDRPTRSERRAACGPAPRPPPEHRAPLPPDRRQGRPVVGAQDVGVLLHLRDGGRDGRARSRCGRSRDAAGVVHSVEKFFGDLLQTKDFTFLDEEILRGALLVAAVFVVLAVVITVIAAAFYNMFAELFGGIEVTITEDETTL